MSHIVTSYPSEVQFIPGWAFYAAMVTTAVGSIFDQPLHGAVSAALWLAWGAVRARVTHQRSIRHQND